MYFRFRSLLPHRTTSTPTGGPAPDQEQSGTSAPPVNLAQRDGERPTTTPPRINGLTAAHNGILAEKRRVGWTQASTPLGRTWHKIAEWTGLRRQADKAKAFVDFIAGGKTFPMANGWQQHRQRVGNAIAVLDLRKNDTGHVTHARSQLPGIPATVKVAPGTLEMLRAGDLAIASVKQLLPYGAFNQVRTMQGPGAATVQARNEQANFEHNKLPIQVSDSDKAVSAAIALAFQAGVCSFQAGVTYLMLRENLPSDWIVSVVQSKKFDHEYVVIEKEGYPERVAVDPWALRAQAVRKQDHFIQDPDETVQFRGAGLRRAGAAIPARMNTTLQPHPGIDVNAALAGGPQSQPDPIRDHVWATTLHGPITYRADAQASTSSAGGSQPQPQDPGPAIDWSEVVKSKLSPEVKDGDSHVSEDEIEALIWKDDPDADLIIDLGLD